MRKIISFILLFLGFALIAFGIFYNFFFEEEKEVQLKSYGDTHIQIENMDEFYIISNIVDNKNLVVFLQSNSSYAKYITVEINYYDSFGKVIKKDESSGLVLSMGKYYFEFSLPKLNDKLPGNIEISFFKEDLSDSIDPTKSFDLSYNYLIAPFNDDNNNIQITITNQELSVSVFKGQYVLLKDNKVVECGVVNLDNFLVNETRVYDDRVSIKIRSDEDYNLIVYPIDYKLF